MVIKWIKVFFIFIFILFQFGCRNNESNQIIYMSDFGEKVEEVLDSDSFSRNKLNDCVVRFLGIKPKDLVASQQGVLIAKMSAGDYYVLGNKNDVKTSSGGGILILLANNRKQNGEYCASLAAAFGTSFVNLSSPLPVVPGGYLEIHSDKSLKFIITYSHEQIQFLSDNGIDCTNITHIQSNNGRVEIRLSGEGGVSGTVLKETDE